MATILIERNIMVPMRDGVKLATDIYRLDGAPPAPVLVVRTPYDEDGVVTGGETFDILRAVQAGHPVVAQDVRGRYASERTFNPHVQETDDGLDAFAWAAAQPWSNGAVGTFGGSYLGCTQWLPARQQPPALRAIAPSVTSSDGFEGCAYQGGAKVCHDLRRVVADIDPADMERRLARGEQPLTSGIPLDVDGALTELPLATQPFVREYAPFYREWLAHPTADDYWLRSSPNAGYEQIGVPALSISGWYDISLWSTFQNYVGMKRRGSGEETDRNQRLIIGPWSHMNFSGSFREREFGWDGSSAAVDLPGIHVRWFDRWLKGVDNGIDQEPPDVFLYNPLRPVPTVGGEVITPGGNAIGPRDPRKVELRDDVLVYSTPMLDRPVEVTGPVELRLFVSSSARDTDLTGKLVDVYPDGRALILTEGVLRARYRDSLSEPESMEPDTVCEPRLNLWATANVFLPGPRIRLEVSSRNFPRFDRNSNTSGIIASEIAEQYQPAINRIYHDAANPSHLVLPIIER